MGFESIFTLLLAILGLGFLVFIHELGHFWMARRTGMKVEAFSVGFGRPIISWIKNGVRWQISWIPFGGFVKIAGMQREDDKEPHDVKDGFYSKSAWQRIQVSFMGPAVNIVFGLLLFGILWISGGREKQFQEFTHRIGWIDPQTALYEKGVRPGDLIESYDGRTFSGFKDLMIAGIMKNSQNRVQGYKVEPLTGKKTNFDYTLNNYALQQSQHNERSIGILSPASYLIYDDLGKPVPPESPIANSGIQNHDRILWLDGEILYSRPHLTHAVNESSTFLTVQRGETIFHSKVPRIHLDELSMTRTQKEELDDWQHEENLSGRFENLYFIPYLLSHSGKVEGRLDFIDEADQKKAFETCQRCAYFNPLQKGDRIVAIDGKTISSSYDLLNQLQQRRVLMIVQRDASLQTPVSWSKADADFGKLLETKDLEKIVSSIGLEHSTKESGHLLLLNSIEPKPHKEISVALGQQEQIDAALKKIEEIADPQVKEEALEQIATHQNQLILGASLSDRPVIYNPSPLEQFGVVLKETWRTLSSLFSGNLSPKYMSGPVGIVQAVQYGWSQGVKEAIFWMGFISLNLGIVNLLPIPVLDGGHIVFSLYEAATRRRISGKTMERLVFPFFGLLIAFFIYITYQDLSRIFSRFF